MWVYKDRPSETVKWFYLVSFHQKYEQEAPPPACMEVEYCMKDAMKQSDI